MAELREDYFINTDCRIWQNPKHFCFNSDSAALARFTDVRKQDSVLEIGCNNGALLVYFARFAPSKLCGVEILPEPAKLARLNLERSVNVDWCVLEGSIEDLDPGLFDVIVCNPPYFPKESVDYAKASLKQQARNEYHLDLERMIAAAARHLKSNGRFSFVHRPNMLAKAISLLEAQGLKLSRLQMVYDRRDEACKAFLAEAVWDKERLLVVERPYWYGQ